MVTRKVARSAVTGRFVTKKAAKKNPRKTVIESMKYSAKKKR